MLRHTESYPADATKNVSAAGIPLSFAAQYLIIALRHLTMPHRKRRFAASWAFPP
jgi:hypothetical protein